MARPNLKPAIIECRYRECGQPFTPRRKPGPPDAYCCKDHKRLERNARQNFRRAKARDAAAVDPESQPWAGRLRGEVMLRMLLADGRDFELNVRTDGGFRVTVNSAQYVEDPEAPEEPAEELPEDAEPDEVEQEPEAPAPAPAPRIVRMSDDGNVSDSGAPPDDRFRSRLSKGPR